MPDRTFEEEAAAREAARDSGRGPSEGRSMASFLLGVQRSAGNSAAGKLVARTVVQRQAPAGPVRAPAPPHAEEDLHYDVATLKRDMQEHQRAEKRLAHLKERGGGPIMEIENPNLRIERLEQLVRQDENAIDLVKMSLGETAKAAPEMISDDGKLVANPARPLGSY